MILGMAEAVDEDVAEVAAEIILKTLKRMKTESQRINQRLLATIVKAKGTLQMNVESPKSKDQKKTLKGKLT